MFFRKKDVEEVAEETQSGFFEEMVFGYIDSSFLDIVDGVVPELYWDADPVKTEGGVYYKVYDVKKKKKDRVQVSKMTHFLENYDNISIAIPYDFCKTAVFNWQPGEESEEEHIKLNIPYNLAKCDYDTKRVFSGNTYVTSLVSAFSEGIKSNFDEMLRLTYFADEKSVVSVYDMVYPLTCYAASRTDINLGETLMGVMRRGDMFYIWNMANLDNKIIPVNSVRVRVSDDDGYADFKSKCETVLSEATRKKRYQPPSDFIYIDGGGGGDGTESIQTARLFEIVKRISPKIKDPKAIMDEDATIAGMILTRELGD